MSKKSLIQRNLSRIILNNNIEIKRRELKKLERDKKTTLEERFSIQKKISKIPRNSSMTRIRNRCIITGRGRGIYKVFMVSRICIRNIASNNYTPGIKKSSW